jgi:hypothetical protein
MTFEEFKKMADATPEINCKSIFKVEMFFIGFWDIGENGEMMDPYIDSYSMDLGVLEIYYFLSYQDAKRKFLSEKRKNPRVFHSARILQLPLEIETHEGEYLSITVFDKKGDISYRSQLPTVDSSVNGEDDINKFYGYLEECMPFYKGEIVEVLDTEAESIRLGIVAETPMSLEDNWERSKKAGHPLDDLDMFRVITGEDESEYFKTDLVFKPSFPISEHIRQRLNEWYEKDLEGGSTDFAALLKLL